MDYETQLLSKVAQSGGAESLISQGVEDRHFYEEQNKEIWDFLISHVKKYKTSPSFDVVKERFPEYNWEIVTDSLDYIKDKFLEQVTRRETYLAVEDMIKIINNNDPQDNARLNEIFLDKANDLARIIPSSNVSRFSDMKKRIASYKLNKESGEKPGIAFGIPKLDELTLGLQPHEYVSITGWTGKGKTTLAMLLAINHYADGKTPMIISLEMGAEEIYRKLDAMAVGLKQQALKGYILEHKDVQKWEEYADKVENAANDIIVVDVDFATVEKVYSETARWNPDVVFVDYLQLLITPKHLKNLWERFGYVSQMFKAQARQMKIPMYGLAQTNVESAQEGAKLTNIAGSKDIGKHSDIVLGLHQNQEMFDMNKMDINIEKNRGGPTGTVEMLWDHQNAIYRSWREEDDVYIRDE